MLKLHAYTSSPNIAPMPGLCHKNPDTLERVLNHITLSNSTAGKCAPMQVVRQPKHGRASTT